MATLIKANGQSTKVSPQNKESFTLEEIYSLLGCEMIEVARTFDNGDTLIVDEEGMLKDNPQYNSQASLICGIPIVGDALLCNNKEFN